MVDQTDSRQFFRRVPSAVVQRDYHKVARLRAGERSAYALLRGSLPGDETNEEFDAAVASLR